MNALPSRPEDLAQRLRGLRFTALTGAGCSTESGIPDYRGPETRNKARNPILGREFARSAEVRKRYWARATLGWQRLSNAKANPAHHALARLERMGKLTGIITQNVDGLHDAAGSQRVIELHGRIAEVICLECRRRGSRDALQARLLGANPGFVEIASEIAPDGDADLPAEHVEKFRVVDCDHCGGPLKPNVVFFGENVARPIVDAAFALVDEAEALLIVGTSLAVFSGYRFLLRAASRKILVAIVNLGEARGEEMATVKVDGAAGVVLPRLVEILERDGVLQPEMRSAPE